MVVCCCLWLFCVVGVDAVDVVAVGVVVRVVGLCCSWLCVSCPVLPMVARVAVLPVLSVFLVSVPSLLFGFPLLPSVFPQPPLPQRLSV